MLVLGLDTGGTYTDAVLLDPAERRIVAKSKVFTTRTNLTECIGECVRALPPESLRTVSLFCISTTLATNAVVEGESGRVGLFLLGRKPDGKLPASVVLHAGGLLDIKGREIQPVSIEEVAGSAREFMGRVDAVAVSGFASVRNPAHELAVGRTARDVTGLPVVYAHELSSSLGHYDRTVTAVINAGLMPKIDALITAVRCIAREFGIEAPIMIVRGDGSLIRDEAARERPIETVLSGPAASIAGALYLSRARDALLLDMGGTTTDIALARGGKVVVDGDGALVGGWRTMVRAASVGTFGLGGDSVIAPGIEPGQLDVGPRRVQPFCVAAAVWPEIGGLLEEYSRLPATDLSTAAHGVFYRLLREPGVTASKIEHFVAGALRDGPLSSAELAGRLEVGISLIPAEEMRRKGILGAVSLTPTDILHAAGELSLWSGGASRAGVAVFAKKMGVRPEVFIEKARERISGKLVASCVDASLRMAGNRDVHGPTLQNLVNGMLSGREEFLETRFRLKKAIVAVGAPVASWMPGVARCLDAELVVPEHADVANAVGAAAGRIRASFEALVRPDREREAFVAHVPDGRREFADRSGAEEWALETVRRLARERIERWGGSDAALSERITPRHVVAADGDELFIETKIVVEATGNPSAIAQETGD